VRLSVAIGCHALTNFIRLNVASLRRVFCDETPLLLYDSPSDANEDIRKVAEDYGCAYFCERANRGHFGGDIQAAVTAIAFAQEHECDIGIKLNQRTILLSTDIPKLLTEAFHDPKVTLVTPGRYPRESILDKESEFHSRFPQSVDVLCFRSKDWDAQGVADRYKQQWTTGTGKYDVYSEVFWANESKRLGSAHKMVDWLTAHTPGEPFKYLRKIQNTESHYNESAIALGLKAGRFVVQEWSKLKPGEYRPSPRA
jgi:hypothetical protein